jgi:CRISPR system Cascade subunit CasE
MLHGAIESCIKGERQRNLWRVDSFEGRQYLLVLSAVKPDFSGLAEQFGYPDASPAFEAKLYDGVLEKLEAGQQWHFRLCANPVVSAKAGPARGKVHAHVTVEQQKHWLLSRAESNGFMVEEDAFDVVHSEWKKFRKRAGSPEEVALRRVVFEGVLAVTDKEKFRNTLVCGIGRGKAYGCGLLTIARRR